MLSMLMVHPLNNELVMLFQSKPSELFDVNSILKSYIGRRTVCFSTSGFREREMFPDMTSSSTSTTLSDKQCNESWSEQIEAEEVEGEHKVR